MPSSKEEKVAAANQQKEFCPVGIDGNQVLSDSDSDCLLCRFCSSCKPPCNSHQNSQTILQCPLCPYQCTMEYRWNLKMHIRIAHSYGQIADAGICSSCIPQPPPAIIGKSSPRAEASAAVPLVIVAEGNNGNVNQQPNVGEIKTTTTTTSIGSLMNNVLSDNPMAPNVDSVEDHMQICHPIPKEHIEAQGGGSGKSGGEAGKHAKTAKGSDDKPPMQYKLKCKQCEHISPNRKEQWAHGQTHSIRKEKQLSCQLCDFVTEYKHQLEYHCRKHKGDQKLWKCTTCKYTCVNSSLLLSHVKKMHTPVYEFRCQECKYQSKYCHSLKMHLLKKGHTRALDPVGSDSSQQSIGEKQPEAKIEEANIQTLTTKNEVLELKVTDPEFAHSNRKNSPRENKPNPDPEVENDKYDDDDFVQLNFPQSELDKSDHGDGTAAGDDAQSNESDLKIAALEVMAKVQMLESENQMLKTKLENQELKAMQRYELLEKKLGKYEQKMEEMTKDMANLNMAREQQKLINARTLKMNEEPGGRILKINCEEAGGRILKINCEEAGGRILKINCEHQGKPQRTLKMHTEIE